MPGIALTAGNKAANEFAEEQGMLSTVKCLWPAFGPNHGVCVSMDSREPKGEVAKRGNT